MCSVIAWAYMAANSTDSQVFIDLNADKNSKMNLEVYRAILSGELYSNAAKLCLTVQMDDNSKHTLKATQELLKPNKWDFLNMLA